MAGRPYFVRKHNSLYTDKVYGVYRTGGKGGVIAAYPSREEAEHDIRERMAQDERVARDEEVRQQLRTAEEIRRATLTPEERQREDDEQALRSLEYQVSHYQQEFTHSVEQIAVGLEFTANKVRQCLAQYQEANRYPASQAMYYILDELSFLSQRTREKYAVNDSYQLVEAQAHVRQLREKLGLHEQEEA